MYSDLGSVFPHIRHDEFNDFELATVMDGTRVFFWDDLFEESRLLRDPFSKIEKPFVNKLEIRAHRTVDKEFVTSAEETFRKRYGIGE